jgi:superfamily II DNA or RNA helicase
MPTAAAQIPSPWRVGARVRVRGRRWRVDEATRGEDCAALRLSELGGVGSSSLTILTPFDEPVPLDHARAPRVVRPRRWLHELDRILANVTPFGALAATSRSSIRLLPYQLEPALAVLDGAATRVLIADGVGLGKTVQAGVLLRELGDNTRALVVVPAGLRDQWASELGSHFGLAALVADASWLRTAVAERPRDVNPWSLPGIYVTSYDFVKRPEVLHPLEALAWDLVVVDEAHNAAPGTDRRAAIHALASRASRVLLLTATPPVDPREFAALCDIGLVHDGSGPPLLFRRSREEVELTAPRRSRVLTVRPSAAEERMHSLLDRYSAAIWKEAAARADDGARLASIVLRKRALSSAGSLLVSVERRLALLGSTPASSSIEQLRLPLDDDRVDDDLASAVLAAPGLADGRRERRWLAAIAEAARAAARAETKLRFLRRLLARIDEPVIVFTEFRDTLLRLQASIAATGRTTVVLHGGMTAAERGRVPDAFRDGVLTLLATDAASEGLNLHHRCRLVVHYELPWNPARLEQRAGRVDRIGQSRRVHEIALVSASTAERLVLAPLALRIGRAHRPNERSSMLASLTESRVAESVMAGVVPVTECDRDPFPTDGGDRLRLQRDAVEEAARLTTQRARLARSPSRGRRRDRGGLPFLSHLVLRAAPGPRVAGNGCTLILVFVLALEGKGDDEVHAEATCLGLSLATGEERVPRTGRQLRAAVATALTSARLTAVDEAIAAMLASVSGRNARLRDSLDRRHQAIALARVSAAKALVQLDLFKRSHARRPVTYEAPLIDDTPPPDHALTGGATLVAAILVETRPCRRRRP